LKTLSFVEDSRQKVEPFVHECLELVPLSVEFYMSGCHRTLDDPAKARWHDKERVLLAAIEAELARQTANDGGGGFLSAEQDDGPPAYTHDDIPF
jgi:hypothetical protein